MWEALRSAAVVLAPPGHPQLPALKEAGIACQVAGEPPSDPDGVPEELARLDGSAMAPGDDIGAELFRLVARARELDLDPETELRAAARRYRDLVRAWERSGGAPADR